MAPKKAAGGKASVADASALSGQPTPRPLYTMSILKNGDVFGTLIFELAVDVLPRTTENFKQLAQGVTVGDKKNPKTATYKGCRFLRLSSEGLQTGDALHKDDGKGNDSIYGPTFDDEAFKVYPHTFGTLSMCNSGPNTNGSQFFICCLPRIVSTTTATQQQPSDGVGINDATPATDGDSNATPSALPADSSSPPTSSTTSVVTSAAYLDSRHVAFGRLMEGSEDVLHRLLEEIQPYVGGAGGEFDDTATAGSIDIQSPFSIGAIGPL
ncbi:cyclophilin type peptidyl-prolyl cis-trans isomerase, putative [Bodo saltans]|uniref:Peptidyl-prolyl cis-trans isomerase n=1 Tax=Bodo saltans TaxID=75058 RepID=A0A0S4J351_BODSA|nr:cyclophilin type peptidyl-prolyl cis-trans isomerase, putative [Bodo saltans]|eukprot:CUG85707.1 cyclophilin type peptidyl-prolyl cis-trans isomerase, putative [Bodo saltans]